MTRLDTPEGPKIDRTPTPEDLVDAPELAILAALERTLDLVVRALVSAHPELADPERPYWLRQASRMPSAAETLVDQSAENETGSRRLPRSRRDPTPRQRARASR